MSKMVVPDNLIEDILEMSFGDHNGLKDEYFVADMISCLIKKLGYKSMSLTDLQKESVAHLLVLFQEEAVARRLSFLTRSGGDPKDYSAKNNTNTP